MPGWLVNLIGGMVVLARRDTNGDEDAWMQLLVFIILAVFWAVGGILRARAEKQEQVKGKDRQRGTKEETRRAEVARQMQADRRAALEHLAAKFEQEKRRQAIQAEKAAEKRPIGIEHKLPKRGAEERRVVPTVETVKRAETAVRKVESAVTAAEPAVEGAQVVGKRAEEVVASAARMIEAMPAVPLGGTVERIGAAGPSEAAELLDSTEQVRRAILCQEILGKCVAMRGPWDYLWMR